MKNPILYFLCFFFLFSCNEKKNTGNTSANGNDDNINKGDVLTHNFYYASPYEYTADSAIIIEVEVNKKKRRFLLDTGAPLCVSKSLQEECKFPMFRETSVNDSNGDSSSVKIVTVNNLKIGGIEFQNIPALVFDMTIFPFECEKLDGIIGSNLLRLLVVQFNKPKQQVIFTDNIDRLGLNPADASDLYPNLSQSDPLVPINIGKNIIDTCTFDSGDKSFYIIAGNKIKDSSETSLPNTYIAARGKGLGTMGMMGKAQLDTKAYVVKFDSFSVGDHLFKNVNAEPTNAERSRIGRGFFDYGIVTLDYLKHKFYLTPYRELVYDDFKSFGISYLENKGKLQIATVWENTEAYKKGLKPGFEIVQVGDFKPSSESECSWSAALHKEAEQKQLQVIYLDETGMQKKIMLWQKIF